MRRREFTSLLGGAFATWLIFASAQGVTSPGLHPIDSGHFALEDHCAEIGSLTRGFLERVMPA